MSYLAPVDGVLNVWVGSVDKGDYAPVTKDSDRGIRDYAWAHDNRHLLYVQDQGGDENWRVYRVDLETGVTTDLTPFEGVQAKIVANSKHHPDQLILALNKDNPQLHDAYLCRLRSGELTKVAENLGFAGWVTDHELKVRGAAQPTMEGGMNVLVRDDETSEWRPFVEFPTEDSLASGPYGFTRDGKGMYLVSSLGANSGRLVRKDLSSGNEELIASDPVYSVSDVLQHPDTKEIQAVAFQRDRLEWEVVDPSVAEDLEGIRALHSGDFAFVGRDHADRTWLVAFDCDDGPVGYYAWDRDAGEGRFLFVQRPELEQYNLAPMEPFVLTSRDGLEVHGYLTFPPGVEKKGLGTVLVVHGGPWARDVWGYNAEAQWLANRGYLCIQVNFRGSLGYGKAFVNAGDREWGGKMQDDLTDTVNWAVERGYADPKRIAIMGGSYGGYAALVGATFTPDLYRCAVAQVGPSNLKTLIETIPPYWKPMEILFHQRVGHPEKDEEFLWSRSPLSKVDQIKIPLLIGHGANDPRVKLSETEQIVAAMKEKGIDHELVVFDDEGHGFAKPENRLSFYRTADRFLATHLGGRAES